jgi:hypothetical protein
MNTEIMLPAVAAEVVDKPRFAGGINRYPPYRSKVNDLLTDEHRPEYEGMIRRKSSITALHRWLKERGYKVGRGSVDRHRQKQEGYYAHVRFGSDVAEQFARVARETGLSLHEASIGGMHQMLMDFFVRQQNNNTLTAADVRSLATGVESFIDSCQKVERIRKEIQEARDATPEDHAAVVDRVREILGV